MAIPAPDCLTEWNYNHHGSDWQCRCNEGYEQSPVDIPDQSCAEPILQNAEFEYLYVPKDSLRVEYLNNLLRIVPKEGINMGRMTDVDQVNSFNTDCL